MGFIVDVFDAVRDFVADAAGWVVDNFVDTFNAIVEFFAPEPQEPNLSSFTAESQGRITQFKQPITAHRFIYGEFRVSGPMTFIDVSSNNSLIHIIITLAAHPVQAIEDIYFGDEVIPADAIDGSTGIVSTGRYAGKARIFKSLGDEGSAQPFPALASATTAWTYRHLQRSCAKIYVRLTFNKDIYPRGVPPISAWVKGKKVVDPRNSSTETWTVNPALIIRDYMTTSTIDGGGGATTLEFDDTFTNSAANTSEEIVSTKRIDTVITAVNTATDIATLVGSTIQIFTGDRVQVSAADPITASTTSTIGGLTSGVDYYVITTQRLDTPRIQFASTYALALAGTAKSLTSSGAGQQTVIKTGEPRYTMNGLLQVDRTPAAMIGDSLTSMAGQLIYASGTWRMKAGVYTAPTITLDENDFLSGITIQTSIGRRSRFNAVKGIYVTSLNLDQPADYPSVTNATYEAEDNNERIFRELDLKNTNRPQTASRLAKISLERHRQMISFKATTTLKGLQLQAGDTVSVDNERLGWSAKVFEIGEWRLTHVADEENPTLGCEMSFRETAATVFDWNSGEETTVDPAPDSNLPDVFTVLPPEALTVIEELYDTRGSAGVKARAIISWTAPDDSSIAEYEVQKQQTQDSDGNSVSENFSVIARTIEVFLNIDDIEPGIYNFRVSSLSLLGVSSTATVKLNQEIFGLLDPPTEPQNLTVSAVGGAAILRWDATPDLDVKVGGTYIFRHDNALIGASWATSVGIGAAIAGSETTVTLPLKSGTYLAKAKDSSGIESTTHAAVSTKQATSVGYTLTSTITESTVFPGSTTNVVAGDRVIKLTASGLVDSIPDVSAVADWDAQGGLVSSGTYFFGTAFDWTEVLAKRYTTTIVATIINANDLIDLRETNIDTWTTVDGATSGADARVYSRETDDDPAGSPTWADWQLLESADLTARAVQFKVELTSDDNAFNIEVSELSVAADTAG